jgi:hypothetical protein
MAYQFFKLNGTENWELYPPSSLDLSNEFVINTSPVDPDLKEDLDPPGNEPQRIIMRRRAHSFRVRYRCTSGWDREHPPTGK